MKRSLVYFTTCLLLASSCKKTTDLPEPDITDPHFYARCNMDGSPLNLTAGDEDYYMNSSWYHEKYTDLYVYKGNLAKQGGGGYQITVLINDYKKTAVNSLMVMDSALRIGEHLYNDQNESGKIQNWTFMPVKAKEQFGTYAWKVTDGENPRNYDADNQHYMISQFLNVGKTYTVSLDYNNGIGTCSNKHTNVFKAGSPVQTMVTAERDITIPGLAYKFKYTVPYQGNWKCRWEFPDTTTAAIEPTRRFGFGTENSIKLTLKDMNSGDSCVCYYQLHATDSESCDANFKASFLPIQNTRLLSSVTILLTDPNGLIYSSQDLVQPTTSTFELLEAVDYERNVNGEQTKRLKLKFNCIVKNGGKEIRLTNGEALMAVSYK